MPLRFPRPVVSVIATGMAAAWVVGASVPASADQIRQHEWWLSALNVAHSWPTSRGAGVTVAVLSDGIDPAQADIKRAVTSGPDFTGTLPAANTFVGLQGTAIASLIAGRGHGGASGIVGVAPQARILSLRVTLDPADPALDAATTGAGLPDAIASGIRYAVAHHATVIDLPTDPGEPNPAAVAALPIPFRKTTAPQVAGITAAAGGSSAEQAAIAFARRKGVVLIAPAGDNAAGTDAPNYPAAYPGVIAVGAVTPSFAAAPFSSHQGYVALTAPGAGVRAAHAYGGYASLDSTDAASAIVSGVAALIRSRYPGLTAAQVGATLTSSTVFRGTGTGTAGPASRTVDAQRALAAAGALAASSDERAGAGAVALSPPSRPGLAVTSDGLAPRILRAAIISAGTLIILLLLVLAYGAAARRRERKDAVASAEWVRSTQNAYSPYGPGEADKMLEFFAAPSGDPVAPADPFTAYPAPQATAAGAASSAAVAARPATATGSPTDSGTGAWVPLGSASRAPSRQPRVSGTPPWEPASEPDSELPWVAAPAASLARPAAPVRTASAEPDWADLTAPTAPAAPPADPSPISPAWDEETGGSRASSTPAGPRSESGADGWPAEATATPSYSPSLAGWPGAEPEPAGGSPFDAAPAHRSPSGSAGELTDHGAEQAGPADDARWQSPDSDAYRPPASDAPPAPAWSVPDTGEFQRPDTGEFQRPPSSDDRWQPAEGNGYLAPRASGSWEPPAAAADWQPAADDTGSWSSPAPDSPWPPASPAASPAAPPWEDAPYTPSDDPGADTGGWSADPGYSDASYAGHGYDSTRQGDQAPPSAQPSAASAASWTPADTDARWNAPSPDAAWVPDSQGGAGWAPDDAQQAAWNQERGSAADWSSGSDTDAQWAATTSRSVPPWESAEDSDIPWNPAAADSPWNSAGADSRWESTGSQARWDPPTAEDARADGALADGTQAAGTPADDDQVFAWRPAAQTETFPAVSDD